MGSAYKGLDRTKWGLVEVPKLASIHGARLRVG